MNVINIINKEIDNVKTETELDTSFDRGFLQALYHIRHVMILEQEKENEQ